MNFLNSIGWVFSFFINRPLGWILGECYRFTHNYGLALILFTIITRIFLLPLAIKQQGSMADNVRMQPKMKKLQKQYGKDKERYNQELMKLYQEEGYNPMGGCLPLLIQLPILYGLFNVIYKPLTYVLGLSQTQIQKIINVLWPQVSAAAGTSLGKNLTAANAIHNSRIEIYAANAMKDNMDKVSSILPHHVMQLDFRFLYLDLSSTPSLKKLSFLILIPIFCYVTSLVSTWYNMRIQKKVMGDQAAGAAGMNTTMILIMPLVSAYFATTVPAGVGFYWICTNLIMILQSWVMNKFFNPNRLVKKAEIKAQAKREKRRAALERAGMLSSDDTTGNDTAEIEETRETTSENTNVQKTPKQIQRKSSGGKKTKKQLQEENRRRLAASRMKDKNHDAE